MQAISEEKKKLFAFIRQFGWYHFEHYRRSPIGRIFVPPDSPESYSTDAAAIFHSGFLSGSMDILKNRVDRRLRGHVDKLWQLYLHVVTGNVLLEGEPYPATSPDVIAKARHLFEWGYLYATSSRP